MAITNNIVIGKNDSGEVIRVGLVDTGLTDGAGNVIWEMAVNIDPAVTIGTVDIDQSVPGTSNGVAVTTVYPVGATPLVAASGNVAAAVATATLAKASGKTTYITGFEVTGSGATAGLPVTVTVVGISGGTLSYTYTAAVGALVANQPLIVAFNPPLPASGTNVDIVVSCPSLGTGNTNNTVVAHGFRI